MNRIFKWAFLPSLVAIAAAVSPVGLSSDPGRIGIADAQCMDCTISANHICGGPIIGVPGYCTSGSSWCKEPAVE